MYSPLIQPNLSRSKTARFFDTWLNSKRSTACSRSKMVTSGA